MVRLVLVATFAPLKTRENGAWGLPYTHRPSKQVRSKTDGPAAMRRATNALIAVWITRINCHSNHNL